MKRLKGWLYEIPKFWTKQRMIRRFNYFYSESVPRASVQRIRCQQYSFDLVNRFVWWIRFNFSVIQNNRIYAGFDFELFLREALKSIWSQSLLAEGRKWNEVSLLFPSTVVTFQCVWWNGSCGVCCCVRVCVCVRTDTFSGIW